MVVSAAVVAAFAAAVILVLLMTVGVLMMPAGMPLTSGVAAVARVVAACCSMGIAWARLMPLLLLVMLLLVEVEVAPAGWPDPVLGRRVPRL